MSDKFVEVDAACLELFTKIICDRSSRGDGITDSQFAYTSVRDMLDYLLSGNYECLVQFDQ